MKSNIITILILIVIIGGGLALVGYFKAIPGAQQDDTSLPQPVIEIYPTTFDFGEVTYGDKAEQTFLVKNAGNAPLEIQKVATSCGCTTATTDKTALAPGEETNLAVVYDTSVMSGAHAKGDQERIIYIRSNDPKHPQIEATIHAYVK